MERLNNINCEDHYLRTVCNNYDLYMRGLRDVLTKLKGKVNDKQWNDLLDKKLQLNLNRFNEAQYLQIACELTVISEFLAYENHHFVYEKKVTPPKDVDFSISNESINYNVEVKCPSYKPVIRKSDKEITITLTNRAPNLDDKNYIVDSLKAPLEKAGKTVTEGKNLDNTLKDFLLSTQSKVKNSSQEDVNILVACCNNALDMQIWREYLTGNNGFFTPNTYIPHEQFNRVDYVLLTNAYNRHYKYFDDVQVSNHWQLASCFNLLYPNRYSKRNMHVTGEKDLEILNSIFPNHNYQFEKYMEDKNDFPVDESFDIKKLVLGVAFYTDKYAERGQYYFSSIKKV